MNILNKPLFHQCIDYIHKEYGSNDPRLVIECYLNSGGKLRKKPMKRAKPLTEPEPAFDNVFESDPELIPMDDHEQAAGRGKKDKGLDALKGMALLQRVYQDK